MLTNSPREHAERILAKLGVADRFEAILIDEADRFADEGLERVRSVHDLDKATALMAKGR